MTTATEATVTTELRAAALALENMRLANAEFHVAIQFQDWERAARAQENTVAYMQSNMDLITAAHRHMSEAG